MRHKNKKAATTRILVAFPTPMYEALKINAQKEERTLNAHLRLLAKRDLEAAARNKAA